MLIFSELSLHLNSTDVNRVLFYTMQKIRNLSLFSELDSYLPYIREYSAPSNNPCTLILGEEILKINKNGFN